MQEYDIDSVKFIEASFFVATPQKIQRLTQFILKTFHQSRSLLKDLKEAGHTNKQNIYDEARQLEREFCLFMQKSSGFTVMTSLTANNHPDAATLARLIMKIFEHFLFLKQTSTGNLSVKAS